LTVVIGFNSQEKIAQIGLIFQAFLFFPQAPF